MNNKRPRMYRPAAVADLLRAALRGTAAEKRLDEGRIWLEWDEAVGEGIARHASPAAFREGTLTVNVDSAPWMQQLTFLKKDLIARVNERLGREMVKDIYLKAGRVRSADPAPPPPKRTPRKLSEQELQWVSEQAEGLADPELREVFAHLVKKDLEHRKDKG